MNIKTIVVKYGSSSVANGEGMDSKRLAAYAANLAEIHNDYGLIVVSSGSVAVGKCLWRHAGKTQKITDRSLAMLGSGLAFTAWQQALARHGIFAGQLPITHREVDDPTEGPSLQRALQENLDNGIITVANENDALSDIELAKLSYGGDNDGLAAHIATKVGARALCLMTDTDGLLTNGCLVRTVGAGEAEWEVAKNYCATKTSLGSLGRGSMLSKVEAATQAAQSGIDAYIANASSDIQEVISGNTGTHFVAAI